MNYELTQIKPIEEIANDIEHRSKVHRLLGELLINVSNKFFKDQKIIIDGYRFINCIFENCEIIVQRGTFEFHNCKLNVSYIYFCEEAQKVVQLLHRTEICGNCNKLPIWLKPKINTDGTVSIGKGASC